MVAGAVALAGALWSWQAAGAAVTVAAASDWIVPSIAVSVCVIGLLTAALLAPSWWYSGAIAVAVAVSVLVVVPDVAVMLVVLVAAALLVRGVMAVADDREDSLRIRPATHVRAGGNRIVAGLALLVTAAIYGTIVAQDAASLMFGTGMRAALRSPVTAMVMPQLKSASGGAEAATVDDFLRAIIASQLEGSAQGPAAAQGLGVQFMEDYAGSVGAELRDMVRPGTSTTTAMRAADIPPAIIAQARTQLSQEVGRTLTGREPVADVFATLLERSMQSYAEKQLLPPGYRYSTAVAALISVILFFLIWSVGALLRPLWGLAVAGIIVLLRMTGILTVTVRMVEKEELA